MTTFPNRVWIKGDNGLWYDREAKAEDHAARSKYIADMQARMAKRLMKDSA